MSFEDLRQQERDRLVRLQTQKLEREQQEIYAQKTRRELAALVAVILVLLTIVFKYPKTTLVLIILAYGALQFGAPAQGAEFNSWVVTLFTNPREAGNELLTTIGSWNSDDSTVASPVNDNATVPNPGVDSQTAPVTTPSTVAPAPSINPMCKQLSWTSPDDIPYLHYYKCPNPNTGD